MAATPRLALPVTHLRAEHLWCLGQLPVAERPRRPAWCAACWGQGQIVEPLLVADDVPRAVGWLPVRCESCSGTGAAHA